MRLAGYAWFGLLDQELLLKLLTATPVAGIALYLGGRIQLEMPPIVFKRMISVLLLGSGAALLLK